MHVSTLADFDPFTTLDGSTIELYLFTAGEARIRLGEEERDVRSGQCVVIPPGIVHRLWNTGSVPLVLLCCCAPAHAYEDIVLVETEDGGPPAERSF